MATRTFLFVDQVRSTEQLTRLGDASAREVRQALFDLLRQATELSGGHEVDFTGDGLFCAFDGAVEAVEAAVAMQQLVHSFNARTEAGRRLAIRVGLNTGEPLESEGGGYFGAAVVVAARLCSAAEEGQILAADVVRVLVESNGTFLLEPVGPLALKGVPAPVQVFSAVWEPEDRRPGLPAALRSDGGISFVGRARELAAVTAAWQGVLAGGDTAGRRLVLLSGDHGMGVTRFAAEVAGRLHGEGAAVWYGAGHGATARLAAWSQALTGWAEEMPRAELRLASGNKVGDLIRLAPGLQQLLPRTPVPAPMDTGAEVFLIADAVDELIARWSVHEPMLIVLDALEEADPETLTVIRRIVESRRTARVLVVACYEPSQVGTSRVLAALAELEGQLDLRLGGLPSEDVERLISAVTGRDVPAPSLRAVLHESEGVPYFVLQMAVGMRERDLTEQVGQAVEQAQELRTDLRLKREEITLGLRQLDQLRSTDPAADVVEVEPEGTPPAPVPCPYKGLVAFGAQDAEDFFGRDALIAELLAKLVSNRFLAVVGASGAGKSSVLRAGLLPGLAAGRVPGSDSWVTTICVAGEDEVVDSLEAAQADARGRPVLIVVDQFERLWTADAGEPAAGPRRAQLDALVTAIDDPEHETVVVVSIRADYYGRTTEHPGLAALMQESQVLVPPMTAGQVRLAIEGPARASGLVLETGLAQAVVDDLGEGPGRLPLLSTAMLETWQRRRGRSLTLSGYAETGGARRAIAQLAETAYAELTPAEQETARRLLLRLAAPGADGDDVARPAALAELETDDVSRRVLARLVDRRLVTVSRSTANVAHEALLREWPRLQAWLDADREGRRLQHRISTQSADWDAAGRDASLLLRGARLAAAEDWTASRPTDLNETEKLYVAASLEVRESDLKQAGRQVRRFQLLSVGLVILLVGAIVALGFGVLQRRAANDRATEADARGLAAQALALSGTKVDTALLLAVEAYRRDPGLDSQGGLLSALNGARYMVRYHRDLPSGIYDLAVTPDRKTLVVLTRSGILSRFDTATWKQLGEPLATGIALPVTVEVSPDGDRVAYGAGDGVHVLDLATGRTVGTTLGDAVRNIPHFSSDGKILGIGSQTGQGMVLNRIADGKKLGEIGVDPPGYVSFAINPVKDELVAATEVDRALRRYRLDGTPIGDPVELPLSAGFPEALSFYPDGRRLLSGNIDGGARIFDATSLKPVGEPFRARGSRIIDVTVQPAAEFVAVAGDDGSIRVVGADTGLVYSNLSGLSGAVVLEYLDDDRLIAATSSEVVEFDLREMGPLGPTASGDGPIWAASATPTGETALVSRGNQLLTVASDLRPAKPGLTSPLAQTLGSALSPDGKVIAVYGADENDKGRLAFVQSADGVVLHEVPVPADVHPDLPALAFSPDGKRLAIGTSEEGKLVVAEVASGRLVVPDVRIDYFAAGAVGWSDDSSAIYFGGQSGVLRRVEATTGKVLQSLPLSLGEQLDGVVRVPGTTLIAVSSESGFVYLVDTRTFTLSGQPLSAGGTQLQSVDVSPDGKRIAAISRDGALRLWDTASRRAIGPALAAHEVQAQAIAYLDQTHLITGSFGQTLIGWDLDPAAWVRRACALAGRNLTTAEWRQYLPGRDYRQTCSSTST